ncbi:MAG TPA: NTP transferase domain-containing protein [Aestuariivirgaceae bacterium]|nr:NTP transferase domain-containing protein [Aestuariivirgaceae bacterium]
MRDVKSEPSWTALVLAAGRGPDDAMARAHGVSHKCLIEVGGKTMLARVLATLRAHPAIGRIAVSIENRKLAEQAIGRLPDDVFVVPSGSTAAASAAAALHSKVLAHPVLLTTADHVLLDQAMLDHFIEGSTATAADLTVGLARAETILAAYPAARRTFLSFGPDRVSGCNLYGLMSPRAARAVAFWRNMEAYRKRPWRLIAGFGVGPLVRYALGRIDLETAFQLGSRRLGLVASPVIMPFAEAAIDVDKPDDKVLCETILKARGSAGS